MYQLPVGRYPSAAAAVATADESPPDQLPVLTKPSDTTLALPPTDMAPPYMLSLSLHRGRGAPTSPPAAWAALAKKKGASGCLTGEVTELAPVAR